MLSVRRSQAVRDEWNRANVLWTYMASFLERATGPQLVVGRAIQEALKQETL